MKRQTKAEIRAAWMARYEDLLVELRPDVRGKVDWDTATYYFLQGAEPEYAATRAAGNLA